MMVARRFVSAKERLDLMAVLVVSVVAVAEPTTADRSYAVQLAATTETVPDYWSPDAEISG